MTDRSVHLKKRKESQRNERAEERFIHRGSTGTIDMQQGPLVRNLIAFALPIALSGMLQQLFNFADTAVVGRFTDASALAAVGTNGEIVALLVTFSAGLAVGVNVMIASAIGRADKEHVYTAQKSAWILAAFCGIILAAGTLLLAKTVLRWIHTPEASFTQAVRYLRIYALGCPALVIYDFASAVLRAHGDSRRPLAAMGISGVGNVALNLFFVIVCKMGVTGVALATDISSVLSAILVVKWLRDLSREHAATLKAENKTAGGIERLLRSEEKPVDNEEGGSLQEEREYVSRAGSTSQEERGLLVKTAAQMLRIGLPAAVQGAVFCFANMFVQAAVNSFGTTVTAGATAAINFEYLTYYAITAFGQTATTFTGQNYAAGNVSRCRQIGRDCVALSALFCGMMTLPLCVFRYQAAALFSGDAAVIEAAVVRMLTILLFEPLCAVYESLSGVLRGMEKSLLPAVETILGICVLRIVWTQTIFARIGTQESLYLGFPVSWAVTSLLVWITYRKAGPFGQNNRLRERNRSAGKDSALQHSA